MKAQFKIQVIVLTDEDRKKIYRMGKVISSRRLKEIDNTDTNKKEK